MAKHDWVEMKITPIQVDVIDTEMITSSDDTQALEAEANSMEFCFKCKTMLHPLALDEECPGEDPEEGQKEV